MLTRLEEQWSKHPADIAAWNALVSVPNMDSVTGPIFTDFVTALTAGIIQHQKPVHLTEKETYELCRMLITSLTAVLASSLAPKRSHAMTCL